jgi:predicted RNase H-like nuclease (RuvC/YqgF family)
MENEKVLQKLREVQICAKEKEKKMAEEIVALMDQLSCSQTSATPKLSKEAVYASLSETLTLRGEISDAKAREETLRNELDKVYKFFHTCHFIRACRKSIDTLPL